MPSVFPFGTKKVISFNMGLTPSEELYLMFRLFTFSISSPYAYITKSKVSDFKKTNMIL